MTAWRRSNAVVGATCGAVAATVATFVAAPWEQLLQDGLRASGISGPVELLGFVAGMGAFGLFFVGWWTVPIGIFAGSIVGALAGRRLMRPFGLLATMFIGAAAVVAILLLRSGVDAVATALGVFALPGAIGGCAAWCVARWITGRRVGTSVVEVGESVRLGGGEGG